MSSFRIPKGTRDLFPPEIDRWLFLEQKIREYYSRFLYQEVRTPIFEHSELFMRGIGDETEVVSKEMYRFRDKAGRDLTLRPENTASLVRAAVENNFMEHLYPPRFYYIGPMFRYDKPQKGRFRQFHQFGVEILGDPTPQADAELIYTSVEFLREIGIDGLTLLVNSVGCRECRPGYLRELRAAAGQADLCDECRGRVAGNCLRIFDCKEEKCRRTVRDLPKILDFLCEDCRRHFDQMKDTLDQYQVPFRIDPTLVRGLDYYTKTAFEIISGQLGAQDALLGGGRYDDLFRELGGPDLPAVGFAAGMERIILHLADFSPPKRKKTMVIYQQPECLNHAIRVARRFWEAGHAALVEYAAQKFKKQFQRANRIEADFAVIIGPEEIRTGELSIKNLKTREQESIKEKDLTKWQKQNL